jgi:SGNH domain (fused to AT3 domains)/Bacterial TSP3 repeat
MPLPRLARTITHVRRVRTLTLTAMLVAVALSGQAAGVQAITDSDHDGLSNAFENAHGLNPNNKDTNHDGLRDAAEDPDGDGLSNLGEQKFGTNPLDADTDNDGTSDSLEDSNGNGIKNGAEQDRRAVPSNLTPSLAKAPKDQPPSYRDGCHSGPYEPAIHPCAYANKHGSKTIAIFGDSHAAQWLAGLIKAGSSRSWKVISITKSACPSVDVQFQEPVFDGAQASCNTWRSRGEKWLRDHTPDLIIISNSHKYRLVDSHGDRIPASGVENRWKQGLGTTLNALPAASKVLVLGDTPVLAVDVPTCLAAHRSNMAACERSQAQILEPAHDAAEAAVAASHNAAFASLNRFVCSYDPCPVVINELLIWRTEGHITSTYAKQLAPSIARVVSQALP